MPATILISDKLLIKYLHVQSLVKIATPGLYQCYITEFTNVYIDGLKKRDCMDLYTFNLSQCGQSQHNLMDEESYRLIHFFTIKL